MRRVSLSLVTLMVILAVAGCQSRLNRSRDSAAEPSASAAMPSPLTAVPKRTPYKRRSLKPVGIPHAIVPGMGLGPVMFGATVASIERHMGMKCEELTPAHCRIFTAGVDFELTDGVVAGIVIHRFDRPIEGQASKLWGVFAGGIPPNVLMTMVPETVIESIGEPKKTETVVEQNVNHTVRRDTYDGMILEYDRNPENDRLMLGGIRIVKKR